MAAVSDPEFDWIGDSHLRIRWKTRELNGSPAPVLAAHTALRAAALVGLVDITPAAASLLLHFDPATLDADVVESRIRAFFRSFATTAISSTSRVVDIPICYDASVAPDLGSVADACSLSEQHVAEAHAHADYVVRFIGFAPGFPYMDGLPPALNVPRLSSPRPRVPAGSVGIAGSQNCIYPHATPGGWRIIGRTPLRLFDASRAEPALLRMGDRIRFFPISLQQFREFAPHLD